MSRPFSSALMTSILGFPKNERMTHGLDAQCNKNILTIMNLKAMKSTGIEAN